MRRFAVILVFLFAAACGTGREVAAPTPSPTPDPQPTGGEPAVRTSPISPLNRPTSIAGQLNGKLPDSELVTVEGHCRESRAAAPSLLRLLTYARSQGVQLSSEGDCYRPYNDQQTVRTGSCAKGNCACAGKPGGSMHGWGKAIDLHDEHGSITSFTSRSYLWLKANAGRFGWNHAKWAEPPTSPCPEAWHWEWVGDGGKVGASAVPYDAIGLVPSRAGYTILRMTGSATVRGTAEAPQSPAPTSLVVAYARAPSGGYWLLTASGQILAVGEAKALGSVTLAHPVAIAATPDGTGAWVIASDGHTASVGTAPKLADTTPTTLPVIGAATAGPNGCFVVLSDGTVVARGTARVHSPAAVMRDVVAIAVTPSRNGYWLADAHGHVRAFGDARSHRSLPPGVLRSPVVSITATPDGGGYWLTTVTGGVYAFGTAHFYGSI